MQQINTQNKQIHKTHCAVELSQNPDKNNIMNILQSIIFSTFVHTRNCTSEYETVCVDQHKIWHTNTLSKS